MKISKTDLNLIWPEFEYLEEYNSYIMTKY